MKLKTCQRYRKSQSDEMIVTLTYSKGKHLYACENDMNTEHSAIIRFESVVFAS